MTHDDIIRMAREAQLICDTRPTTCWREDHDLTPQLQRFAALVAAAEREACARVCDEQSQLQLDERVMRGIDVCADAIRARGQQ